MTHIPAQQVRREEARSLLEANPKKIGAGSDGVSAQELVATFGSGNLNKPLFDPLSEPYLQLRLGQLQADKLKKLKQGELPLPDSYNLVILPDFSESVHSASTAIAHSLASQLRPFPCPWLRALRQAYPMVVWRHTLRASSCPGRRVSHRMRLTRCVGPTNPRAIGLTTGLSTRSSPAVTPTRTVRRCSCTVHPACTQATSRRQQYNTRSRCDR